MAQSNGNTMAVLTVAVIIAGAAIAAVLLLSIDRDGADVTVYTDSGISVEISGNFFGETTLEAELDESTEFGGWYSDKGRLLSKNTEYTSMLYDGDVIYAYSAKYLDAEMDTETDVAGLLGIPSDVQVTIGSSDYDGSSPETVGTVTVFPSPGVYALQYEIGDSHRCARILVDGEISTTFEWSYSTEVEPVFNFFKHRYKVSEDKFGITLDILYSDYLHYVDVYSEDERYSYYSNKTGSEEDLAHDMSYVDYDDVQDPYIQQIADYIAAKTAGKSEQYVANIILTFVQSIPYAYDYDVHGTSEYWQFPLETLFLNSGDCEDTSMLFCAIASAMGYDSALFIFTDHMGAGISIDGFEPTRSTSSSVKHGVYGWQVTSGEGEEKTTTDYYYCETTADGWLVGEVPADEYEKFIRSCEVPAKSADPL